MKKSFILLCLSALLPVSAFAEVSSSKSLTKSDCDANFPFMAMGIKSQASSISSLMEKKKLSAQEAQREWLELSLLEKDEDESAFRACLHTNYKTARARAVKKAVREIFAELNKTSPHASNQAAPDAPKAAR